MSSDLSVIECIRKYALAYQQEEAKNHIHYPYPEADGSELGASLKNAALKCDLAAIDVLIEQLRFGMFGQHQGNRKARLDCIKEARKETEHLIFTPGVTLLDHPYHIALNRLTNAKQLLTSKTPCTTSHSS